MTPNTNENINTETLSAEKIIKNCSRQLREIGVPHFIMIPDDKKKEVNFNYEVVLPAEIPDRKEDNAAFDAFFLEYLQHKLISEALYKDLLLNGRSDLQLESYIIRGENGKVIYDAEKLLAGLKEENMYDILINFIEVLMAKYR